MDTSLKSAQVSIFTDILSESISRHIGYEAGLADVSFSFEVLGNYALKFKIKGCYDRLNHYIIELLEAMEEPRRRRIEKRRKLPG